MDYVFGMFCRRGVNLVCLLKMTPHPIEFEMYYPQ